MTQSKVEPIYRGGKNSAENRGVKELIETEWKIIDKLQNLIETASYDKPRGFYYQTLASHIRTLSTLLKNHGQPNNQTEDLAKLLSQIRQKAKTLAKRLKTIEKRTRKTSRKPNPIR